MMTTLMQTDFPERADPWRLAINGRRLLGEIPLRRMPRLSSLLSRADGSVRVCLQAGVDECKVHFFAGRLDTTLELVCQRCTNPLRLPLAVEFRLGLVHNEVQSAELPEEYEPLLVPPGGLAMSDWVEDELILALPLIPVHAARDECEALDSALLGKPEAKLECGLNPFAALAKLLNKRDED
jgi:uncharacterized protein